MFRVLEGHTFFLKKRRENVGDFSDQRDVLCLLFATL